MLTVCTLPSERKIQVKDKLTLDIVIPNLQSLKRTPDKSIIIEIIRNEEDLGKISHLEFLQPNYKNIWLISVMPLSVTSNIILDINNFLKEAGDRSLRFSH